MDDTVKKMLLRRIVALIGTVFLLVCSVFAYLNHDSLGWFSLNKHTSASGLSVSAKYQNVELEIASGTCSGGNWTYGEYTSLDAETPIDLELSIPGSVARFKLKVKNPSESSVITIFELGFAGFGAEEETAKDGYYLGTQLTAGLVGSSDANYIASYEDGSLDLLPAENIPLFTGNAEIAANGEEVFEIEVTFVNKDEDQSPYALFGAGDESCKRRIYLLFD